MTPKANSVRQRGMRLSTAAAAVAATAGIMLVSINQLPQSALAFVTPETSLKSHTTSRSNSAICASSTTKTALNVLQEPRSSTIDLDMGLDTDSTNSDLPELLGLTASDNYLESAPPSSSSSPSLSEEQREFELKLGKAMDTLRSDYPEMLTSNPDFSIYHENIEVVDPTGVTLHNIKNYKTSFNFLHGIINFFYCPETSSLTFRLIYDCARKNIRISWNAILIPRAIYGGVGNKLHVDGISVYEMDRKSGLITQHRVEHLLVNDSPVQAPQGIFNALASKAAEGGQEGVPVGVPVWNYVEFRNEFWNRRPKSLLFSTDASSSDAEQSPLFNREAYEKKNAYRRKFGLKPITPDEFIKIEAEVQELALIQQQKAEDAAAARSASADAAEMANSKPKNGFLNNLFGNLLEDTCESNYDCERPEVCCDLGFKKMCCSSGSRIFDGAPGQQLERIPIRVVADDGEFPRGGPDGMDRY